MTKKLQLVLINVLTRSICEHQSFTRQWVYRCV